jgi:mono/diheme cytochrome c family protein
MKMNGKGRWALGLAAGLCLGSVTEIAAQQVTLPSQVSEWLERDQVQRWAAMIAEGDSIFNSGSCARCHGNGGSGGPNGPDLTDATWVQSDGSLEEIRRTIFWGVRRELLSDPSLRFEMNPGGGMAPTWEQHASLAAYVWSLSNETGLPGR